MKYAVKSSLDVAFWFSDKALNDREYIQPQKLHRLMYLAQAYYSVAYPGRKLMPAVFVTDEFGPIEPTLFHLLAYGRPHLIEPNPMQETVRHFLDSVWRRFGASSADTLSQKVRAHGPVVEAMTKGVGEEIPFEVMLAYYSDEAAAKLGGAPPVDQVLRPRVMRSQSGRPVSVSVWKPKVTPKAE